MRRSSTNKTFALRTGRAGTVTATTAALLLLAATTASAQLRAGGDGRALDANQQVGSGGANPVENAIDFSARNNLVTGNVAGGFNFRDSVGYGAPGEFRGDLGSSDLFRFRANSLGSSPVIAGSRGYVSPAGVSVYNDFASPGTGRYAPDATNYVGDGGVFRVHRDVYSQSPYELSVTQPYAADGPNPVLRTSILNDNTRLTTGVLTTPSGQGLAITADPLVGLRRQRTKPLEDPAALPMRDPATTIPGLENIPDLRPGPATNYLDPVGPASTALRQGSVNELRQAQAAAPQLPDLAGRVPPTIQLGQLTSNRFEASNPAAIEQRIANLEATIFGTPTPGSTPAPGSIPVPGTVPGTTPGTPGDADPTVSVGGDSYANLMAEIRRQAEERVGITNDEATAEAEDTRPAWMKALDEPAEEEVEQAENNLQAVLDRIRGNVERRRSAAEAARTSAPGSNAPGMEGDTPGADDPGSRTEADAAVEDLMQSLSYDVRLETLVAEREGRLNELFADGEAAMAAGKFLDAERAYRQVRLEAPDNPLGEAGMIHAQLGAGMIRSAAFNLRRLFAAHPELIATRYGQNLLPPTDRLTWLQGELKRSIETGAGDFEPGLMMAYLGHQVESRQLVRYGLAIAEQANPLDPLLPVVRRIWLGEGDQEAVNDGATK